ncbi:MAG: membrane dipeptidase [Betaproteobacteria bacterium]
MSVVATKSIPPGVYASPEALALHREMIVFDCLSLSYLIDPPYVERAMEGGVSVTNLTMATEGETFDKVLENIDTALDKIARHPDLVLATTAVEVREAKRKGKLAIILGTQGSEAIGKQLNRVGLLHKLGVRYIGLAYTGATLLADGCGEPRDAGLTFLGRDFIEVVNGLPMILDLSHTGHRSRLEAAQLAKNPVCTHSNAYTVNPNDRNSKDEVARIIAAKGGVMGVCGLVRSVAPKDSTIEHMLDHARHWVDTVGADHTGIGLDFTEGYQDAFKAGKTKPQTHRWRVLRPDIFGSSEEFFTVEYPTGLQSIRLLPNFTHGLLERGHKPEQVREIMGGSWMRNLEFAVG